MFKRLNEMDKHSGKERHISSEDILKTLDRFGSKTPSPVEDEGRNCRFKCYSDVTLSMNVLISLRTSPILENFGALANDSR